MEIYVNFYSFEEICERFVAVVRHIKFCRIQYEFMVTKTSSVVQKVIFIFGFPNLTNIFRK